MEYQPVKFITQCNLPFIVGNIVKYISRYKLKNGAEDILKCIHYAEIAQELKIQKTYSLESLQTDAYTNELTRCYIEANKLNRLQAGIVHAAVQYSFGSVIAMCEQLMRQEYPDDAKKDEKKFCGFIKNYYVCITNKTPRRRRAPSTCVVVRRLEK